MSKFTVKYTGLLSPDKFEEVKASFISEFSYGPEEAEFYLNNPPIELMETDDESAAKEKYQKLKNAGAVVEFKSSESSTPIQIQETSTENKKDPVQDLIFELEEENTVSDSKITPPIETAKPDLSKNEPEITLEFESESNTAPQVSTSQTDKPAKTESNPPLELELELEDSPEAIATEAKEPSPEPAKPADDAPPLDLSFETEEPAKAEVNKTPAEPPKNEEKKTNHIELETSEQTVFKIDPKVLSGSTALKSTSVKKAKLISKIPPEYIIPLLAGAGVILVMAYILFPQKSVYEVPVAATQTNSDEDTSETVTEQIKFYKYTSEFKDEFITAKANFTATDKGVKFVTIDLTTPPPTEQTAEEIVLRKSAQPWLSKITIDKLNFVYNKENDSYDTSSQIRAFLEQGDDKVRIVAPFIGRAKYKPGQKEFKVAFLLKYNYKEIPPGKTYGIFAENESYGFFVKFQMTAKLKED